MTPFSLRTLPTAALFTALTLTLHGTPAHAQERRTLTGSSIAVYDLVGRVEVQAGSGSDVIVEMRRGGRDASRLTLAVGQIRGREALRVEFPDDDIIYPEIGRSSSSFSVDRDGTWDDDGGRRGGRERRIRVRGSGRGLEAWADLRVLVPEGRQIDVHLGVGELVASNVRGELRLATASGRVNASRLRGTIKLATGSGSIDARELNGEEITAETGSGSIETRDIVARRCQLETGSGGISGSGIKCEDLKVSSGSGSVRLDDLTGSDLIVETGSGGITLAMRNSPRRLKVETGSGAVTVALPANLSAQLDIQSGSGGIDSDFPVQVNRMERNRLRGAVGGGSGTIRIETGSGGVRLRKN